MSSDIKKKIELEVVYVLFLDIVGYSKRATSEQHALIDQLNQLCAARMNSSGRKARID